MSLRPLLLDLLEPVVVDFNSLPAGEYDEIRQVFRYTKSDPLAGGTQRTQSYQNASTSPSVLTGSEDYDDQYVTTTD